MRAWARTLAFGPALLLLAGCCWTRASRGPETLVVVVPSRHDGHVGTVVVGQGDERQVLDTAFAAVRSSGSGKPLRTEVKPEQLQSIFAAASEALPPRAESFTLYFALGKPDLTPESRATLARIVNSLAERPATQILVAGHSDRMGTPEDNEALSLRRAERMRELLIREGVSADVVQTVGMGEREPVIETEDGIAEARNRRVEITLR